MDRVCAYEECGVKFTPKTHNQRYHTDECCRRATNERLMRNYYEKKARRQGRARICSTPGCTTRLSRYNDTTVCQFCEAEIESAKRAALLRLLA